MKMLKYIFIIYLYFFTFSFCYDYEDIIPFTYNSFSLTKEHSYVIFRFNNTPYQLNNGYILFYLQKNSYDKIQIYIYDNFDKIKEESKDNFTDYYLKTSFTSSERGIKAFNDFHSGTYFFIISTPNYNYKDSVLIHNPFEYYLLPIDTTFFRTLNLYISGMYRYFYFKTPKFSTIKYLDFNCHLDEIFVLKIYKEIGGSIEYNLEHKNYRISKSILLQPNIEYGIIFSYHSSYVTIYRILEISFFFSDYEYIKSIDIYNTLTIPLFISSSYYYVHFEIASFYENEIIYFKMNQYFENDVKFCGKFYDTLDVNEIEKSLPNCNADSSVFIKEDSNNQAYGYFKKTNQNYKSFVLATHTHYSNLNYFRIWRSSTYKRVTSSLSQTYKYSVHMSFYIDEISFKTNTQYIILFSGVENIIHITNYPYLFYYNSSKLYIIGKNMLSSFEKNTFNFEVYNTDKSDFYFEIKYMDNINLHYYNKLSRNEINNVEIKINDCSKKTFFISTFREKKKKNIFVVNTFDKNVKTYFQNDKIIYNNIDDLLNINKIYGLVNYPKLMETNYDLFQFTCEKPSTIRINYYKAENNINKIYLEKGKSYQFYIKEGISETYFIDFSFIKFNFYYKIMLFEKNTPSTINIDFCGNELILTENKPIIKKEIEKINSQKFTISSNVEILLFLYIATERSIFQSISSQNKIQNLENEFSLFLFSNLYKQKEFSNLYITNNGNLNINVCIHKSNDYLSNMEKWIFIESNCFELSKNSKFLLYLDNPFLNGKNNEMNYISLYTKNYQNILYDYEYRDVIELKSYQKYNIKLNENKYYIIFKYYNNQTIKEGELRILFNKKNNDQSVKLYVYYDKTYIHETLNIFDNYIYNNIINNKVSYVSNNKLYLPIGYWYIIIVSNLGNEYEDNFIIYNQNEYYELSEKIFDWKYYIDNNTDYAYFKISPLQKYLTLHYEWYNNLNECTNSIIINNEQISDFKHSISDNYEIKDKTKDNIIKINFKTSKIGVYSKILLYLTENKKILYLKNDFKPIKITILSAQIIYIFNDLSRDDLNENIYFKLNNDKISNPKIKFYNTYNLDSILNSLPKSLEQFDIEMNSYGNDIYYYNKTNINNKYAILGIEVPFSDFKEYNFQKIDFPRLIKGNFKKIFLKNETKGYYINEDSFMNKNVKILLFAERDNIISFKEGFDTKFYNKNNIYLISYNMLKEYSKIEFTISEPNKLKDYLFEIRYLDDENLYYYNTDSRFKLNNIYYEINDCSKNYYIIGLYENIESNSIFYINSIDGNTKIYYKNSISELDDLFNLSNENLYKYPFIINSKNDFIKISCIIPSKVEIIYYNIQKEGTINLEKGFVVPFYIEKNQKLELIINQNSLLFGETFYSKIKLIQNKYEDGMSIDIVFNNISWTLNNTNYYIENQNEKLKKETILFNSGNSNCFLFIYISLDVYSINYIKNEIANSKFIKPNNIFVFPLNLVSNINSIANIYIINKENEKSSDICFNKNYGDIERIYNEKNNCMKLRKGEYITFSLFHENIKNIVNEKITYYLIAYTENIKDFEYTFNFYTYSNLVSYQSFDFNIGKNNYIILSFENKKFDKFTEELNGEIIFKFEKGKLNGSNLYIYEDLKEIHKNDNIFDNYISKIDLNNDYLFTYNFPKNLKYYFIIKSNEKEFQDRIIIYNPIIPLD